MSCIMYLTQADDRSALKEKAMTATKNAKPNGKLNVKDGAANLKAGTTSPTASESISPSPAEPPQDGNGAGTRSAIPSTRNKPGLR